MREKHYHADSSELHDQQWEDLYRWLFPLVRKWVWNARISSWCGQQQEITEDITAETLLRTFQQYQLSHKGETSPIYSLKALSKTIAYHYFQDRIRKDKRLIQLSSSRCALFIGKAATSNVEQVACEHLIETELLIASARTIAHIPPRQRLAMLIDLAQRATFDESTTTLEQALAAQGIQLREYRDLSSCSPDEHAQYASLRSLAYKRLKKDMAR